MRKKKRPAATATTASDLSNYPESALTTQLDEAVSRAAYARLAHITRDHVPPGGPTDPEQWSKWFYNERVEARRVNLHVRVAGRANQRYAVLFRDYLRANSAAAAAYGQVKMALADYHPEDATRTTRSRIRYATS